MANPIETAVAPIKAHAVERAEKDARAMVERIMAKLAECGWDAHLAAPFPSSRGSKADYVSGKAKYELFRFLTAQDPAHRPDYRLNSPEMRVRDDAKVERFIEEAKEMAALQYDAFVAKLVAKIGDTTAATLNGSHVWGHSILTVTLPNGTVERWKTQQIVNVSKLHKLFNQWPTRKVK